MLKQSPPLLKGGLVLLLERYVTQSRTFLLCIIKNKRGTEDRSYIKLCNKL